MTTEFRKEFKSNKGPIFSLAALPNGDLVTGYKFCTIEIRDRYSKTNLNWSFKLDK